MPSSCCLFIPLQGRILVPLYPLSTLITNAEFTREQGHQQISFAQRIRPQDNRFRLLQWHGMWFLFYLRIRKRSRIQLPILPTQAVLCKEAAQDNMARKPEGTRAITSNQGYSLTAHSSWTETRYWSASCPACRA